MTVPSSPARADSPAPAATDLAHDLIASGWTLSGAKVRFIHTARLTTAGITIEVTYEAGEVRLKFESTPRSLPSAYRAEWHAVANNVLPAPLLAAVSAANHAATNRDETTMGELLTAAGWQHIEDDGWAAPRSGASVFRIPEDLCDDGPLRWRIRRSDLAVEIRASDSTPPAVIAALALTGLLP